MGKVKGMDRKRLRENTRKARANNMGKMRQKGPWKRGGAKAQGRGRVKGTCQRGGVTGVPTRPCSAVVSTMRSGGREKP